MDQKKKKPLTIAVVSDVYDDMKNGAAISLERFVNILRKKHRVIVVSTGADGKDKFSVPSFYPPLVKNIMIKMKFPFAWPDKNILEKAFNGVDIIHLQFPFYLGMKAIEVAEKMNIPVVSAFHVQPENISYNLGIKREFMVSLLYKLFINRVYNKTKAVICPSPFAENELKRHGLKAESHVISNGVMPIFKPMKVTRPEKFRDKFIILSVGRLAKDKRHDVLIHAINRSQYRDKIQLIITGDGPIKEKLIEMGNILPNKPLFQFLPLDELIRLYNTADLYVHPSEVELESMSVLEAIACGLPALISDSKHSATRQFAINESFLFKCDDVDNLVSKIDYWIENEKKLKNYREEYVQVAKKYTIDESIKKLETIYYDHVRKG